MTNERPGYWDVERCAWVGAEPTHVVPPVRAPPVDAGVAADAVDAGVPTPRTGAEAAPSAPVVADSTAG